MKMTEVVKAPAAHADPEASRSVIFVDRGRHRILFCHVPTSVN